MIHRIGKDIGRRVSATTSGSSIVGYCCSVMIPELQGQLTIPPPSSRLNNFGTIEPPSIPLAAVLECFLPVVAQARCELGRNHLTNKIQRMYLVHT